MFGFLVSRSKKKSTDAQLQLGITFPPRQRKRRVLRSETEGGPEGCHVLHIISTNKRFLPTPGVVSLEKLFFSGLTTDRLFVQVSRSTLLELQRCPTWNTRMAASDFGRTQMWQRDSNLPLDGKINCSKKRHLVLCEIKSLCLI